VPIIADDPGTTRASRIQGVRRFGGHVAPAQDAGVLDGDDHVGDVAVDHIVAIECQCADRRAGGQLLQGVTVWIIAGQQGQFCQRGAQ